MSGTIGSSPSTSQCRAAVGSSNQHTLSVIKRFANCHCILVATAHSADTAMSTLRPIFAWTCIVFLTRACRMRDIRKVRIGGLSGRRRGSSGCVMKPASNAKVAIVPIAPDGKPRIRSQSPTRAYRSKFSGRKYKLLILLAPRDGFEITQKTSAI